MDKQSAKRAPRERPGQDDSDYEVGYGKPPARTQFTPGQSGNPKGRPRGAKAKSVPAWNEERLKTIILEEAYRPITVRDGNRQVEIPTIQAVMRSIALNAAKGDQRSRRLFVDLLQGVEREYKALADEWLKTMIEYKVDGEFELRRRELNGETGPEPLPHPDDIFIERKTGQAEIRGPMTKDEKAEWDLLSQRLHDYNVEIKKLEKLATENPNDREIREDLNSQIRIRASLVEAIPDWAWPSLLRQRLSLQKTTLKSTIRPESTGLP